MVFAASQEIGGGKIDLYSYVMDCSSSFDSGSSNYAVPRAWWIEFQLQKQEYTSTKITSDLSCLAISTKKSTQHNQTLIKKDWTAAAGCQKAPRIFANSSRFFWSCKIDGPTFFPADKRSISHTTMALTRRGNKETVKHVSICKVWHTHQADESKEGDDFARHLPSQNYRIKAADGFWIQMCSL